MPENLDIWFVSSYGEVFHSIFYLWEFTMFFQLTRRIQKVTYIWLKYIYINWSIKAESGERHLDYWCCHEEGRSRRKQMPWGQIRVCHLSGTRNRVWHLSEEGKDTKIFRNKSKQANKQQQNKQTPVGPEKERDIELCKLGMAVDRNWYMSLSAILELKLPCGGLETRFPQE